MATHLEHGTNRTDGSAHGSDSALETGRKTELKPQILNQLRELSMMMIRIRTQVSRIDDGMQERAYRHLAERRMAQRQARMAERGHDRVRMPGMPNPMEALGGGDYALRGQGRVLLTLTLRSTVSQRDLATILGLSRQALGQLLGKLEAKGYISRKPSDGDRRVAMVEITEKGRKAAQQLHKTMQNAADAFDCLDAEELVQFSGYLQRVIENIEKKYPEDEFVERRRMMKEAMREFREANMQEGEE
ncbi:MAG: MarR family transcriptional regulator [Bifidobacterium sp.]|uniref:MarR family winged helix-turn-helix transcriptional regulator n=1 Tax=Bifidobacterium sp. TaxID=41200 RepID=UPI0039EA0617